MSSNYELEQALACKQMEVEDLRQKLDAAEDNNKKLLDELYRIANMEDSNGEHVCCNGLVDKPHSEWCNVWKIITETKET